jgi:hypothetical protein
MPRDAARARSGANRTSLYDEITAKILAELEAGRVPWVQPWGTAAAKTPLAMPKNASTGRFYSGISVLILWGSVIEHGFPVQGWLTFRQALGLGGNVRKSQHGTTVVYADRFIPDDEKKCAQETGEEAQAIPFLKRFTVFNLAQCEGLPENLVVAAPPPEPGLIPRKKAEKEVGGLARLRRRADDGAVVRAQHLQPRADVIGMAYGRQDAERGATKCGVHLGDQLFERVLLGAEGTREIRRVKTGVSIEELAEDIARRTLLQSLNVRPVLDAEGVESGMFEVPAGGRRYRAPASRQTEAPRQDRAGALRRARRQRRHLRRRRLVGRERSPRAAPSP